MPENDVPMDTTATESHDEPAEAPVVDAEGKRVPVTEAIRYRKRAQAAEQQLGEMSRRLEALEGELSEARQTVSHLERRQTIDHLLAEADAVDVEAARLLTERVVAEMEEPDLRLAVEDLRRHRPYLFRHRSPEGHGVMAARYEAAAEPSEQAAERAMSTGDRRDLLQYLRLRRRGR